MKGDYHMQAIHRQIDNAMVLQQDVCEVENNDSIVIRLKTAYIYFILYSFIGWIYETIFTSIDEGCLQKRGFLDLPILPIYGFAITIIVWVLANKGYGMIQLFFRSALVTSIMEFVVSWSMEMIFHRVWWDYSHMRFQIQGRVCLAGAILFGVASVIILKFVHPRIAVLSRKFVISEKSKYFCIASIVVILVDTVLVSLRLL